MAEYGYTTIFEPLPEGGFSVVIPAIPEICTFGESLADAREMARDAIRCYLESVIENGAKMGKNGAACHPAPFSVSQAP